MSQIKIRAPEQQRITQEVWAIVDALPQREAINDGDARHWVDTVVGTYGELAKWHATRAGGFGGSQIGALVRNHHGQRADHMASARNIVEGALLRRVPDEPTGQMQRGIDMEPSHRKWFLRKYGAHRDEKGLAVLSSSTGMRQWMRYSPDELAFMPNPLDANDDSMQRWLGDYKAPTAVDKSDMVAFQYVAQLHMGRLVCEHNGLRVDGMILSQFDWGNWSLKDDVIPYIPELDQLILQAGDHYWDYVLRGQVPPYIRKELLQEGKELSDELADKAFRLSRVKAMANFLDKAAESMQKEIIQRLSEVRFGGSALSIPGSLKVSAVSVFDADKVREAVPEEVLAAVPVKENRSRYDMDKLLERVRATLQPGEKLKQFLAPGNLDSEALYKAIVDAGLDADALMGEQLRVALDPSVVVDAERFIRTQFPDLLPYGKDSSEVQEIDGSAGGESALAQENREGQHESRHVPRLITA